MLITKLKIAIDEQAQNFADEVPWLLISFAICVATCIVVYFLLVLIEYCFSPNPRKYYNGNRRRYFKAYLRIGLIVFALIIFTGGFWTAAQIYGLQFFSILLTYGLATFVLTYTFSIPLQNTGAFIFTALTAKVSEGDFITVEGTRIQGTVIYMGILYSTLSFQNETIDVPSLIFLTSVIRHREVPVESTTGGGGGGIGKRLFY